MKNLSPIEEAVVFYVDTGAPKKIIEEDLSEDFPEAEIRSALNQLVADGTLTSSTKEDWVVVSEWSPNQAAKMKAGEI